MRIWRRRSLFQLLYRRLRCRGRRDRRRFLLLRSFARRWHGLRSLVFVILLVESFEGTEEEYITVMCGVYSTVDDVDACPGAG